MYKLEAKRSLEMWSKTEEGAGFVQEWTNQRRKGVKKYPSHKTRGTREGTGECSYTECVVTSGVMGTKRGRAVRAAREG